MSTVLNNMRDNVVFCTSGIKCDTLTQS